MINKKRAAVVIPLIALTCAIMGDVTRAEVDSGWPLGTDFDKQLTVFQRKNITPETLAVILVFNGGYLQPYGLDAGVWDTEASVNLFVHGMDGVIVYYGAGITPYQPTIAFNDGHTVMGSATIKNGRLDIPIPVVSRDVEIRTPANTTKPLYLMLWIHVDPENAGRLDAIQAYGFMGTRKVHSYQN